MVKLTARRARGVLRKAVVYSAVPVLRPVYLVT